MSKTDYVGIDYGVGRSNVDKETGIRYGVIRQHSVGDAWSDQAEPDYGKPSCPKCGNDAKELSGQNDFDKTEEWEKAKYESEDYLCEDCKYVFGGESAFPEEPLGFNYEGDGYILTDCLDSDIMVLKSPYYTFAQFCSPCVPGAGNLESPCDTGPKTFCLGHNWFEGDVAPYPVFSVKNGKEIIVVKENVPCRNCKGTGRDTISRLASVRKVSQKEVLDQLANGIFSDQLEDYSPMDLTFQCFRCDGKGTTVETKEVEAE